MSDFASAILSGSTENSATLATVLDSYLPGRVTTAQVSTVQNVASTTPTALDSPGLSVTGVVADELLLFLFTGTFSCGVAGEQVAFRNWINSDDKQNFMIYRGAAVNTGGDEGTLSSFAIGLGYSGTVSFYSKFYRYTGAGTVYCKYRNYACIQMKKRS